MITTEQVLLLQQLEDDVRTMRELQNTYFRDRNQFNLTNARAAERKVDEKLTRLKILGNGGKQTLFTRDEVAREILSADTINLTPFKDGNMWSVLYGDNIQEGFVGFGPTIFDALAAFIADFIDYFKPGTPGVKRPFGPTQYEEAAK